jgi:hypothetical protein
MMNKKITRNHLLARLAVATTLAFAHQAVYAEEAKTTATETKDWKTASGALEAAGVSPNDLSFMKDMGLTIGGWVNASVAANLNGSDDRFNGPVTFNDRTGEVQLNQLYLWLQKAVEVSGDKFDWGFRADFMYGSDAIFTQAYGVPTFHLRTGETRHERGNWDLHLYDRDSRFQSIAIPQAYAEFNLPFGNGIDLKIGHFYTILGYEVVTAPDNMFITHAYTMQYGEPFTHTGFLGSYTFNPNWTVKAGAVTGSGTGGWDGGFNQQLGNWAFLGGFTWTSDDANSTVTVNGTAGQRSEQSESVWAMYSLVATHNFTDKLHYVFQHDHGFADNVATAKGVRDASWYGINQYLTYDMTDKFTIGMRAEWFKDADGFRVAGPGRCVAGTNADAFGNVSSYTCPNITGYVPGGSNYYAITGGFTFKPMPWLAFRANARYDYADIKTFDSGDRRDQFLFTGDFILKF